MKKSEAKAILELLQYDVRQNKKINISINCNNVTVSFLKKNKNIEISVYNSSKEYVKNIISLKKIYSINHFKILNNKELNFISFLINKAYIQSL